MSLIRICKRGHAWDRHAYRQCRVCKIEREKITKPAYDKIRLARPEERAKRAAYRKAHASKELHRTRYLRSQYGITQGQYEAMLSAQNGVCAVCFGPPDGRGFVIDHDHGNGDVRGILCYPCNIGIGLLKDNPFRMERAARYLSKWSIQEPVWTVPDTVLARFA